MKRIAIIGGGISGLTAAYELEKAREAGAPLDWHLYEASDRLGGIIETTRIATPEGEYILEGGPDGWVSEKPWARELAIELDLGEELIYSNDATRKTYIYLDSQNQAIPDGMRLMVPEDLAALESSPLFSADARRDYANELAHAAELKTTSPLLDATHDESVATFVHRHFGQEVLDKLAAPLLSGVFGGDVHKLSVRAVMPQFVRMEQEHGSLIFALQHAKRERGGKAPQAIFTSLRRGMASLTEALAGRLSKDRITFATEAVGLEPVRVGLNVYTSRFKGEYDDQSDWTPELFDGAILCTSARDTRALLHFLPHRQIKPTGFADPLIPSNASSAILVSLVWSPEQAKAFNVPVGFGFLAPQQNMPRVSFWRKALSSLTENVELLTPQLLACTFVDQKFDHRAPAGARVLRAFFGSEAAEHFTNSSDQAIADAALQQLAAILGTLPPPSHTEVRRWPHSLPQYEVGHLERMAQLGALVTNLPGLTLLGNSYRGVGLPDLIRDAKTAAHRIIEDK